MYIQVYKWRHSVWSYIFNKKKINSSQFVEKKGREFRIQTIALFRVLQLKSIKILNCNFQVIPFEVWFIDFESEFNWNELEKFDRTFLAVIKVVRL